MSDSKSKDTSTHVTDAITAPNDTELKLHRHFSQFFDKTGKFDFKAFKQELSASEVNFTTESYGMDWLGKSYARLLATDPARTLLTPDTDWNSQPGHQDSQNLLIKGDNLEVLKHLSQAYYEKVKMIYIDPPYNTGSDGFVYQDDRKFSPAEFAKLAGVELDEAKRVLSFVDSKSNSHSAWLTFMYPRLYIARTLLKDDGVIFISIDDNEVAQLRLMMDEIFGEENFVVNAPTIMNLKGNQDEYGFAGTHEYTLIYSKNKESLALNEFLVDEENILSDWLIDEKGFYKQGANLKSTGVNAAREKRPNLFYPIFISHDNSIYVTDNNQPLSGEDFILYPKTEGRDMTWRWSKEKVLNESDEIILSGSTPNVSLYKKQRPKLGETPTKKPKSFFYKAEYSSGNGTNELNRVLNVSFGSEIRPKPIQLIKDFVILSSKQDDLILDFFAGSGTTGHAVMAQNVEDGGDRRYILVQLDEKTDKKSEAYKSGYKSIFDLTRDRLTRAADKIRTDHPEYTGDLGFKVFETLPIWDGYRQEIQDFDPQATLFDESRLSEQDITSLLVTWKTYDGIALTEDLEEVDLGGYTAYYGAERLYLMHRGFSTKHIVTLLQRIDEVEDFTPKSIVVFGYMFETKHLREISESVKNFANKKHIDIEVITRY